jgi:Transglutaminase-like superfamily/Coenzyme PQQ synthesis protein D (PqqD)
VTSRSPSGQTVVLDLRSGTYLGLDSSAARIVQLLNEDSDPLHAAGELVARFGIDPDRASADVESVMAAVQGLTAPRVDKGRYPTLRGTRISVNHWWRLPYRHRLAVVQATVAVGLVEIGLATVNLSRLSRLLRVPLSADRRATPLPPPEDLSMLSEREQRAFWSVRWVLDRWLFDGTCLRQALAFGWFIRRHDPVLRLGMTEEDDAIAHAWVEAEGVAFNATPVTEEFVAGVHAPK